MFKDPFPLISDTITISSPYDEADQYKEDGHLQNNTTICEDGVCEKRVNNTYKYVSSPSTIDIADDIRFPDDDGQKYCSYVPDFKDNDDRLFSDAQLSTIQAVTMMFTWFSTFPGISKEAFNKLLSLLHDFILPSGNNLPANYREAKKMIDPYLSPITEYHCCINDCIIYRDSRDGKFS